MCIFLCSYVDWVFLKVGYLLIVRCNKALCEVDLDYSLEKDEDPCAYSYGSDDGEHEVDFNRRNCDGGNYRVEVLSIFCAATEGPLTFRDN